MRIIFLVMLSARISLILSYCSLAVKETKRGEVRVKGIKVVIFSDPDFNNCPIYKVLFIIFISATTMGKKDTVVFH